MPFRLVALLFVCLLSVATGCRHVETPPTAPTPGLPADPGAEKVTWILVQVEGMLPPPSTADRPATIRFESGVQRITGFSGVNRFFGSYKAAGPAIKISEIGSTRMAGSPEAMALEQKLLSVLPTVEAWMIKDNTLILVANSKIVATFSRGSQAGGR